MKVLMQGRVELNKIGGGDKIQIENTALELRKLGVEIDITTKVMPDVSKYDLVHIFQLDWTPETYLNTLNAKKYKKPLVLSPIHHSLVEVLRFEEEYVFDFRRISKVITKNQFLRDTLKNMYRSCFFIQKLPATLISLVLGLYNMQKKVLAVADLVLVQTTKEAVDLQQTYKVSFDWQKVPNGVGQVFFDNSHYVNKLPFTDYILAVGRIEPRKNTLNIIEAVESLRKKLNKNLQLVFIGTKTINKHPEYILRFMWALKKNPWIHYISYVKYEEIPSYYHYAKVCVSASWFETTGLTSLEALFCGTNAVAAGERAAEYLQNLVSYCDPGDVISIQNAIEKEYFAKRPVINFDKMNEYTWQNTAWKTLECYSNLLAKLAKNDK